MTRTRVKNGFKIVTWLSQELNGLKRVEIKPFNFITVAWAVKILKFMLRSFKPRLIGTTSRDLKICSSNWPLFASQESCMSGMTQITLGDPSSLSSQFFSSSEFLLFILN